MVQQLLSTPAFHRAVEKVARQVHRMRHGIPPEELGGTKIDRPGDSGFLQHFVDEVKTQIGAVENKSVTGGTGVNIDARVMADQGTSKRIKEEAERVVDESAEAVWRDAQRNVASQVSKQTMTGESDASAEAVWREAQRNTASQAPKQSIFGEFGSAIREQFKNGRKE